MHKVRNALLSCLVFTSIVWSAPSPHNHKKAGLLSRIQTVSGVQKKTAVLAKKAALQWMQTGTTHYTNTNTDTDGTEATWEFSSRDTIIYDAAGNEIARKISSAHSGWNTDSLAYFDSTVYQNGKLTESFYFDDFYDGKTRNGTLYSCNYLNDGKTRVTIGYDWDTLISKWILSWKDSIIYTEPVNSLDMRGNISKMTFYAEYDYDTTDSSWVFGVSFSQIDGECNSTTRVMERKEMEGDSVYKEKIIYTFSSSIWSEDNLIEERYQKLNPAGEYYDSHKSSYSADRSTYSYYDWDPKSNAPVSTYLYIYFKDSHKNDTLYINCRYYTNSLDTTSMTRYTRLYDANGNNLTTVESHYNSYYRWQIYRKEVNTFAQLTIPVFRLKADSRKNLSMLQTAGFIRFSAPDITGLELYSIDGRLVTSVKQNAASSVTLNLAGPNAKVSSGSYIAKLVCKDAVKPIPLVIKK